MSHTQCRKKSLAILFISYVVPEFSLAFQRCLESKLSLSIVDLSPEQKKVRSLSSSAQKLLLHAVCTLHFCLLSVIRTPSCSCCSIVWVFQFQQLISVVQGPICAEVSSGECHRRIHCKAASTPSQQERLCRQKRTCEKPSWALAGA